MHCLFEILKICLRAGRYERRPPRVWGLRWTEQAQGGQCARTAARQEPELRVCQTPLHPPHGRFKLFFF